MPTVLSRENRTLNLMLNNLGIISKLKVCMAAHWHRIQDIYNNYNYTYFFGLCPLNTQSRAIVNSAKGGSHSEKRGGSPLPKTMFETCFPYEINQHKHQCVHLLYIENSLLITGKGLVLMPTYIGSHCHSYIPYITMATDSSDSVSESSFSPFKIEMKILIKIKNVYK